jgi:hypothetical protein
VTNQISMVRGFLVLRPTVVKYSTLSDSDAVKSGMGIVMTPYRQSLNQQFLAPSLVNRDDEYPMRCFCPSTQKARENGSFDSAQQPTYHGYGINSAKHTSRWGDDTSRPHVRAQSIAPQSQSIVRICICPETFR